MVNDYLLVILLVVYCLRHIPKKRFRRWAEPLLLQGFVHLHALLQLELSCDRAQERAQEVAQRHAGRCCRWMDEL